MRKKRRRCRGSRRTCGRRRDFLNRRKIGKNGLGVRRAGSERGQRIAQAPGSFRVVAVVAVVAVDEVDESAVLVEMLKGVDQGCLPAGKQRERENDPR